MMGCLIRQLIVIMKLFLNAVSAEKDDYLFAVEAIESQAFIGTVAAYAFNWKNGTCHVGISIGKSEQG